MGADALRERRWPTVMWISGTGGSGRGRRGAGGAVRGQGEWVRTVPIERRVHRSATVLWISDIAHTSWSHWSAVMRRSVESWTQR